MLPDVSFDDLAEQATRSRRPGHPLSVPEAMRSARAMTALAGRQAIGFCPFGIEATAGAGAALLGQTYPVLRHLTPRLTGQAPTIAVAALSPTVNHDGTADPAPQVVTAGHYRLTVTSQGVVGATPPSPAVGGEPATCCRAQAA